MRLSTNQINLGYIAAFLGLIQSTVWIVLSIICIVMYHEGTPINSGDISTYMEFYSLTLYSRYLNKYYIATSDYVINPDGFTVFAWLYLFLDFAWLIVSIALFYGMKNSKINLINTMKAWIGIASCIWLVDLIFAILLGVDHSKCMDYSLKNIVAEGICITISIPVITIILKGYILYVLNLIFIYVIYKMVTAVSKGNVNNYGGTIPRPTLQRSYSSSPSGLQSLQRNDRNPNNPYAPQSSNMYPGQQHPARNPGYPMAEGRAPQPPLQSPTRPNDNFNNNFSYGNNNNQNFNNGYGKNPNNNNYYGDSRY